MIIGTVSVSASRGRRIAAYRRPEVWSLVSLKVSWGRRGGVTSVESYFTMQVIFEYEANGPGHRMVLDSIDLAPQKIRTASS